MNDYRESGRIASKNPLPVKTVEFAREPANLKPMCLFHQALDLSFHVQMAVDALGNWTCN
jgi:hypothetical protein